MRSPESKKVKIVFAVIFVALLAGYLRHHSSGEPRMQANSDPAVAVRAEPAQPVVTRSRPRALAPVIESSPTDSPWNNEALRCLSQSSLFSSFHFQFQDLEKLIDAVSGRTGLSPDIVAKVIRIDRADGEWRMRIVSGDKKSANGTIPLKAFLFSTDAEGLPIPQKTPRDWNGLTAEKMEERFVGSGRVIEEEQTVVLKQALTSPQSRVSGRLVTQNSKIKELQLFFDGHSLGCSIDLNQSVHCSCLK
jgi:hypothetical protein